MRAGARPAAGFVPLAVFALVVGIAAVTAIEPPVPVSAQEPAATPTAVPTRRPATCAERYPAEGPGGVDLLLGCVVNELVGYATGLEPSDAPARLSAYAWPIILAIAALIAIAVVIRTIQRWVALRLAPAAPMAWRSCPSCHSVTPADRPTCYRCGRPLEAAAAELRTDAEPPAPQSFGRRFNGRRRKDEPG